MTVATGLEWADWSASSTETEFSAVSLTMVTLISESNWPSHKTEPEPESLVMVGRDMSATGKSLTFRWRAVTSS